MPPVPRPELSQLTSREIEDGEEIVITGMAGRFPKSKNIKEFQENLFGKVDLLSESNERWDLEHPELPPKLGLLDEHDVFDYMYFKINGMQAEGMDAGSRIMLECSCEALIDAGVNPNEIKDSNTGVFIGGSVSESEMYFNLGSKYIDAFALPGCARAMFSNRISYYLGITGPSYTTDGADTSGSLMLEHAYDSIRRGDCDAALVGCPNLCMHPYRNINLSRMGLLSKDGRTRCFCDDADGCGRAESVVVVFLQKAKHAKRIYAELVYAKSTFSNLVLDNQDNFRYVNSEQMTSFLREFYNQINIEPEMVKYVEAFGSGIKDVDKDEIECFDRIFCNRQRSEPLLIGSVKSNIGHAEMASDMCSLVKVLLIYHNNKIAPNYASDKLRTDIKALSEGRMRLINDSTPFGRGYAAINCLSINGVQGHILLKDYQTPQISVDNGTELAELVCVSGRVEESIEETFLDLESKPMNYQQLALLRSMNETAMPGFSFRGYSLLTTKGDQTVSLTKFKEFNNGEIRSVWFVYSGMGAQWPGMAKQLMKIPVFAETIKKLHKILERYDVDLISVITSEDPTIMENIFNCFIGNTAVQIALTDVLTFVGIDPDHIIGHSGGEVACAYADGSLTAEQTITVAYYRGIVSEKTPFEKGLMAAVGMGYNAIKNMLPPRVQVACHNGPESCTIAGPYDGIKEYVEELKSKGIFAKEVSSSNIAYHSDLIRIGLKAHLDFLKDVIPVPKLRSPKWIPSAIPQEKWDDPVLKYCNAEYFTKNFSDPVLFEEVCNLCPDNAILIEIAPHALMQSILKKSLPECLNVPLTRRGHEDNSVLVLSALGKLFTAGLQPNIQKLYPPVKFPVPADTPFLSHTLKWSHVENLKCPKYIPGDEKTSTERYVTLTTKDEEYKFLKGYQIGDVSYVSPSALLVLVWETLGMVLGVPYKELSIEFQNVRIDSDVELNNDLVTLSVILQRASGVFEIAKDGITVASGIIEAKKNKLNKSNNKIAGDNEKTVLTSGEVYRIFGLRGYNFRGAYRSLYNINTNFTKAEVQWKENWAAFIDGLIQIGLLIDSKNLVKPKYIQSLIVDVKEQDLAASAGQFHAVFDEVMNSIRCAGVEIRNMTLVNVTKPKHSMLSKIAEQPKGGKKSDPIANAQLNIGEPGDLDTFVWVQDPRILKSDTDKILVQVHYARIAYADLMRAQNRHIPGETETDRKTFGISFSGITKSGERVMGLVESGAASNYVQAIPDFLWKVPDHWTLEEAATVPQAYAQTLYCLFGRSSRKLTPDAKVLVTSGAGALGQAIINVCLAYGCEVFTTVSDAKKKTLLLKLFPTLKESNICNSTEQNISDIVLCGTNGKGCDIIISAAHGSERMSAVQCCKEMASFLDIGIEDLVEGGQFGMAFLSGDRNYIVTIFASIFNEANAEMRQFFQKTIYKGIQEGWVRPISHVVFDTSETSKAFKTISTRGNHGAILLRLQKEQQSTTSGITVPTWQCTEGTYVVICGRKNIGIEIADKLVNLGAKKIVIGCTDSNSTYLKFKLKSWQEKGVQIGLSPANFSAQTAYIDFMTTASNLGSIRGLFIVNNINIINNMDQVTRTLFPGLHHFVAVEYRDDKGVSEIENICVTRSKAGLTSTLITCPIAQNQNQNEDIIYEEMATTLNEKIRDLEVLLLNYQNSIQNGAAHKPTNIYIDDLMELIGLDAANINTDLTLEEMNVNLTSAKTLSLVLEVKRGISCAPQQLIKMTLSEITELTLTNEKKTTKEGYSLLFSRFNCDEINASEPYLWAETQRCENFKITEYSEGEDYMIVIPGIEGNADSLLHICKQLKIRALVCKFSANKIAHTVNQIAQELTELIIRRVGINSRFYILGFEYGSSIGLEMAAIFENNGLQGRVFCLNGSPMATKQLIQSRRNSTSENESENQYLLHMCSLIAKNGSFDELAVFLNTADDWSEKLDCCLRHLRTKTTSTTEYQRIVIESGWKRICQTLNYNPSIKLSSPIVLIKESSPRNLPEDYGLQQYSFDPVSVFDLETNHEDILGDFTVTDIVNRGLDENVLQKFEEANLCVKYTVLDP